MRLSKTQHKAISKAEPKAAGTGIESLLLAEAADPAGSMTPVLLAQARSLPKLLARLPDCTPPDSIERCILVASLEKLLVQYGVDGDELLREQLMEGDGSAPGGPTDCAAARKTPSQADTKPSER